MVRVAFKPTATIARNQRTVSRDGRDIELRARGRHDPCVVGYMGPLLPVTLCFLRLRTPALGSSSSNNGTFRCLFWIWRWAGLD